MADTPRYEPSKVIAVFLTQFDTRSGYKLVWSKSLVPEFDLNGIDYKVLPSGIHEFEKTTVLISHYHANKLYYGLSRYRQYTLGEPVTSESVTIDSSLVSSEGISNYKDTGASEGPEGIKINDYPEHHEVDRSKIKMYSLGILCDPTSKLTTGSNYDKAPSSWKPNEFINNGWEYVDLLDTYLIKYLHSENFDEFQSFDKLFDSVTAPNSHLHIPASPSTPFQPNISNHLLTKLPDLIELFGPLIFILYKQSLLRKRILIFNHNQHSTTTDTKASSDYYYMVNSFAYVISLLSVIPQNIETVSKDEKNNYYSQPIYNIGLHDLSGSGLLETKGFIGSTNDDILLYQKNLYDVGVLLNHEDFDYPSVFDTKDIKVNSLDPKKKVRASLKDYTKFKSIYNELHKSKSHPGQLGKVFTNHSNISTEDLNSLNTKVSTSTFVEASSDVLDEPTWWLNNATEPVSWRESIWLAFSWFASAGQPVTSGGNKPVSPNFHDEENRGRTLDLLQLVNIVGYFHNLTKKWIYLINEIVSEQLEDQRPDSTESQAAEVEDTDDMNASLFSSLTSSNKINVELTYQDLVDMELDPYCEQDIQFVQEFVLLYWSSVVDTVEIGIGIGGICC